MELEIPFSIENYYVLIQTERHKDDDDDDIYLYLIHDSHNERSFSIRFEDYIDLYYDYLDEMREVVDTRPWMNKCEGFLYFLSAMRKDKWGFIDDIVYNEINFQINEYDDSFKYIKDIIYKKLNEITESDNEKDLNVEIAITGRDYKYVLITKEAALKLYRLAIEESS